MKKLVILLCTIALVFAVTACGDSEESTVYGRVTAADGKTITVSTSKIGLGTFGGKERDRNRPSDSDMRQKRKSDSDFRQDRKSDSDMWKKRPSDSDHQSTRPSENGFSGFGQGKKLSESDFSSAADKTEIDISKAKISRSDGISAIADDIKTGDTVTVVMKGTKAVSVTIEVD